VVVVDVEDVDGVDTVVEFADVVEEDDDEDEDEFILFFHCCEKLQNQNPLFRADRSLR
jgi:hypothetical protein